jgi:Protein of unknown function (DUF1553)/Protein of unknown function (DUF1549)
MWKRNLLFVGLVLGAATALWAELLPPRIALPGTRPKVSPVSDALPFDGEIVARVNEAFRGEWSNQQLAVAPRASELTIYRRLTLALTGTIPSLEDIRRFEARPEGQRVGPELELLLGDRRFADCFGERLARVFVGTEAGPFILYRRHRFVAWLSDELMRNRPVDALARELIAGEGIWTDRPEINFVTVTFDPAVKRPDPERLAARTARAFLGVRLDCAQCHDHPFQSWKRQDFQGLAAFFGQVQNSAGGFRDDGRTMYEMTNRATGKGVPVAPRVPFLPALLPAAGTPRARLARWVTDPANPYFPRATVNRVWALLFGRPLAAPVDDLTGVDEPPEALRLLAEDFVTHGYDLKRLIRVIAATRVFQLDSGLEPEPTEAHEAAWAVFPLTRLRPEQVVGAISQAASLETINDDSHILVKLVTGTDQRKFVHRYGDAGEDAFDSQPGTIPQRLLLMNGVIVNNKTKPSPFNAAQRIAMQAPTDHAAVELAYLTILTRRPTPDESAHFTAKLAAARGAVRNERMSDLAWTLINATEFSWNH